MSASSVFASAHVDDLFTALRRLRTDEECRAFFSDLCSTGEVLGLADRFFIARCAKQGMPYRVISAKTGASSATIARVVHALKYGTGTLSDICADCATHSNLTKMSRLIRSPFGL